MDLVVIKRLSILVVIWLTLFVSIIITNAIGISWYIYALTIAIAFTILKLWNISLQEPLMDINLNYLEMFISVILAVLVALFGGALMQLETIAKTTWKTYYLAFVMTSSQFTLLKVSKFNHILAYFQISITTKHLMIIIVTISERSTRSGLTNSWLQSGSLSIKTYLLLHTVKYLNLL